MDSPSGHKDVDTTLKRCRMPTGLFFIHPVCCGLGTLDHNYCWISNIWIVNIKH